MTLGPAVLEKRADVGGDVVMVRPSDPARLTIDITHALRGSIEIAASQWGTTHMLRELLSREFNVNPGDPK